MGTRVLRTPTSRCLFGVSRCNITPPVGIYHRFWGAALQDVATGVHRPLTATVLAFQSLPGAGDTSRPRLLISLDHCLLRPVEMAELLAQIGALSGIGEQQLVCAFSHTHSGAHLNRDRAHLPGGHLIAEYLEHLPSKLAAGCLAALASLQPATITYATGECRLGQHRDFWDEDGNQFVCGFNPEGKADQALLTARVTDDSHAVLATIVNYGCHPTTLAWENSLISPDYVGALREVVEQATAAPCAFLLSACGDVGPLHQYVGDCSVADRNGRQVGYAALSLLESMPPPGTDYHYAGAMLSGATLGVWEHRPHDAERVAGAGRFRCAETEIDLPYLPSLPTLEQAERELEALVAQESEAMAAADPEAGRRIRALTERQRRLLDRLRPLPPADDYPLPFRVWQLGDAYWVALEGEPYNCLQAELRRRFPETPIVITTIANGARCCYLPTRDAYDKALYQVEIALLAPGCLEALTEAIAGQITELAARTAVRAGSG